MAAGLNDIPDYSPKFHFRQRQQSRIINHDYVVLHTLSNEYERNWSTNKWNELVERILSRYPSMHIVEIGLENIIESNNNRYHNFTSKLDLQEIAHLINSSVLFIGVESGFAHMANALSKNSIILIGYFQKFKNYMVYSGGFARGENVRLLYYQGLVENLEIDEVEKAVDARLQTTEKTVVL
jgi:heptosyltransferase-3